MSPRAFRLIRVPLRLRCEFLENPLGLDEPRPRLQWAIAGAGRGAAAEGGRIVVGRDRRAVSRGCGEAWEAALPKREAGGAVRYGGRPLESRTAYFWRVRWMDAGGRWSPWSRAASFETGLLDRADWSARWIVPRRPRLFRTPGTTLLGKYRGDYIQAHGVYFRRAFSARTRIRRGRIYSCGLGFYEMHLNGQRIGDHLLDPAPTDYHQQALYATHDITSLLRPKNEVLAVVGNGRHIETFGYGGPKLIAQIEIEYQDGTREILGTDSSWSSGRGPIRENGLYYGEVYDARIEAGAGGWTPAAEVDGPPLRAQALPPVRVRERIRPRRDWPSGPGRRIFDFGRNFAGWVRIEARGRRGRTAVVRHAELLRENGSLNTDPNQGAAATETYTFRGGGREAYEPRFTQHGFRYAEVAAPEAVLRTTRILGVAVSTGVAPAGRFRCSHALLNRIHANVRRGLLSNLMGIPTDCPQRDERHGWLADAHLSAEAAILNFDMAAFYLKFLRDIRDAQDRRGRLPDFVPPYLARLAPADPAWGSAYIILAWLMYWYYGDLGVLDEHYRAIRRYVDYLQGRSRGGIIEDLGKYGDWCPPGSIPPKKTPLALTSTWFFCHDTMRLAQIASALGRKDEAARYGKAAEAVRRAFNRRFLGGREYEALRTSPVDRFASQTSNALPLWLGLVPAGRKKGVLDALLRSVTGDQDYHLDTGILGTRYLLDVLSKHGHTETAFRVASQSSYPGWGYMIREGATTLWERWEKITGGGMNSHNHIMLGSVDAWFYKYLGGARCAGPGWTRLVIDPPHIQGLDSAAAKIQTVRGVVEIEWERDEDRLRLRARIPVGAEAEIRLPLPESFGPAAAGSKSGPRTRGRVLENGRRIWDGRRFRGGEGLSLIRADRNRLILRALSGAYDFAVR